MRIVLAFSGGLDTSFCVPFLVEEYGAEVVTVIVNTGGADAEALAAVAARSRALGAVGHREVDARTAVYDDHISVLIRGNVLRGDVYPLSVAAERTRQAIEVATVATEVDADAVAHGYTGAGNDQVRFDVAFRALLPDAEILTPIRDHGFTREQTTAYLADRGLPVPEGSSRYSVNRGLWGTTLGGDWTLDPWTAPPSDAFPAPGTGAGSAPKDIVLRFEDGLPTALDGEDLSGVPLVEALEELTTARGIGHGIHLGETVLGIKGRIGFTAGPALLLIHAHRELEKLVLTKWQSFWKDQVARFYGSHLHEGQYFDPVMRDLEAMIISSQGRVAGEVRISLRPGRFEITGVRSPFALHDPEIAIYGEENALWNGAEARAFAKLSAIPSLLAFRAGGRS